MARSYKQALVGIAATVGLFGALAPAVSAGQLHAARSRVAALSRQAMAEAELLHGLGLRYQAETSRAAFLHAEVLATESTVASTRAGYLRTEALLQDEAVLSYADGLPALSPADQPSGDFQETVDRSAYLSVAVGDLSQTLVELKAEERQLTKEIATANRQLRAVRAATRNAALARSEALAHAASLQSLLAAARAQVAALASASHSRTGPPVGHGIVAAVAQEMKAPTSVRASDRARPAGLVRHIASVVAGPTTTATAPSTVTSRRVPTTNDPPPTTAPPTTAPPTTAPPTTAPPTTAPPTTATPTTAPPTTSAPDEASGAPTGGAWLELRECESGDNYQADTGNGFYGAYQFSASTWVDLGYPGRPDEEPYWMQDQAAARLEATAGWGSWPSCSAALGL